jgi:uncharacterized protein
MSALHNFAAAQPDVFLGVGGLLVGMIFAAIVNATNFCTMGAISDWYAAGSSQRLGAVALAAATAIVGAQWLDAQGLTDLSKSVYLTPRINWLSAILGGLIFGAGMVYAGGCPSRSLVRAGGGDLRAIVSLVVLAVAAYATLSGVFAQMRIWLAMTTSYDLSSAGTSSQSLTAVSGVSRLAATIAIAAPLLAFAFVRGNIARAPRHVLSGLGVGLLASAAWLLTGLTLNDFEAVPGQTSALSFVKPVADAIDWLERSTALGLPNFGAATVFGVLFGAGISSAASGRLGLSGFADAADLKRHMAGGAAMGVGGVLALGCSIGQGISGVSTLALQSLIAAAAIFVGAVLALKRLEKSL